LLAGGATSPGAALGRGFGLLLRYLWCDMPLLRTNSSVIFKKRLLRTGTSVQHKPGERLALFLEFQVVSP
jgi:hypothetical protein